MAGFTVRKFIQSRRDESIVLPSLRDFDILPLINPSHKWLGYFQPVTGDPAKLALFDHGQG
jgi:hypothetical protein